MGWGWLDGVVYTRWMVDVDVVVSRAGTIVKSTTGSRFERMLLAFILLFCASYNVSYPLRSELMRA
jgi:hypothetical protein